MEIKTKFNSLHTKNMIQRKEKICKGFGKAEGYGCGRPRYLFSSGLCEYCSNVFRLKTGKVKTKIKKPTGELAMFNEIWKERVHKSFLTGISLDQYAGTPYFPNLFAHVLNKKSYPLYRLVKQNIILLTPEEHNLMDLGTIEKRLNYANKIKDLGGKCDWMEIYRLREKLILELT